MGIRLFVHVALLGVGESSILGVSDNMKIIFSLFLLLGACGLQEDPIQFRVEYLDGKSLQSFIDNVKEFPYKSSRYEEIMNFSASEYLGVSYEKINLMGIEPDIAVKSEVKSEGVGQISYAYTYIGYKRNRDIYDMSDEGMSLYFHEGKLVLIRIFKGGVSDEYYGDRNHIYKGAWAYY